MGRKHIAIVSGLMLIAAVGGAFVFKHVWPSSDVMAAVAPPPAAPIVAGNGGRSMTCRSISTGSGR